MKKEMACHLWNVTLLCPSAGILRDSEVLVQEGKIARIGRNLYCPAGTQSVDARGALCIPGLINSHNHSPLMIVRGMVEDLGFAPAYTPGVPQGHWLSDEQTLALSRLGILEMLSAGSTTIVDYYRCPSALARAADEFGLRALVGGRIMDADSAALAEGRFERDPALGNQTWDAAMAIFEDWSGHERIAPILAPHAPDTCSRDLLLQARRFAESHGCQVHTHLAQSRLEVAHVSAREGLSPVAFLDDLGLLNGRLVAAHCIFMDDDDVTRFGRAQSIVAHAPIGNAAFGAAAPVVALREAGARITLCTDTKSADMFEAMRMAIAAARFRSGGEFVLDAREVFSWATSGGAEAIEGHEATGTLTEGAPADLVLLDPAAANIRPVLDGFGIVVHSGSGANVTDVMVAGEWLVRDRRPTRVDPEEVIRTAQEVAEDLWSRV
jgi:5-methylthioadenosine/S-adenosylhomocysteine deaminase